MLTACARGDESAATKPELSESSQVRLGQLGQLGQLAEMERYLHDRSFRRDALLSSLTSNENHYSKRRIASYALAEGGWDALPEWTPKVRRVLSTPSSIPNSELPFERVWDGHQPTSEAQWIALGRRVFFNYPLRAEAPARYALAHRQTAASIGLGPIEDPQDSRWQDDWVGLVSFIDDQGDEKIGITCALCHSAAIDGEWVEGRARRSFDYGAMRLAWYEGTKRPLDPELAQRMRAWGPGRADITDDSEADPVAIPDLWGIAKLEHLTTAGTLRHHGPSALAIRQETQVLFANGQRTRPPRVLMWALAMYVYSLQPPERTRTPAASDEEQLTRQRGAEIFDKHCSGCHANTTRSGPLVPAALVGTDPALANGPARGTGLYRPAPLIDLLRAAPYLHDASVPSLERLLADDRTPRDAHPFGCSLPAPDKAALLAFLRGL